MTDETQFKLAQKIKMLEDQIEKLSTLEKSWSFVPLTTPLTSTDFDGDSFSTTAKTKIDLSVKFGVPAGIKAVLLYYGIKDSASETSNCYIAFSPNDVSEDYAALLKIYGLNNDVQYTNSAIVPCDANGDIYYRILASGAGTLDAWMKIWGYYR